jgi:hypothetical protein
LRAARGPRRRRRRGARPQPFPARARRFEGRAVKERESLYRRLQDQARIGVGIASVEEIEVLNIYWARMLAMTRAVEALGFEPAWILVDGNACPRWTRPPRRSSAATPAAARSPPPQSSPR